MAYLNAHYDSPLVLHSWFQFLGVFLLLFFSCLTYFGVQRISYQTEFDNQSTQTQLRQYKDMKLAVHAVATWQQSLYLSETEQDLFNSQRFLLAANSKLEALLNEYRQPKQYVRPESQVRLSGIMERMLRFNQDVKQQNQIFYSILNYVLFKILFLVI